MPLPLSEIIIIIIRCIQGCKEMQWWGILPGSSSGSGESKSRALIAFQIIVNVYHNHDYIIIFPLNSRLVNAGHSILWHVPIWSHPQKLALMVLSCSLPMSFSTLLRGRSAEWIIVIKTRSSSCCRLHMHSNNIMIVIWHCLLWTLWTELNLYRNL